jgi:hypothetical protein
VTVLLCLLAAGAASAGAGAPSAADGPAEGSALHGNHVSADAQVVADGEVLVESLFSIDAAYLVIRADDDGDLGEPIGTTRLEGGYHRAVTVETESSYWEGRDGPTTVHAALHRDDGDGEFDPETDTLLRSVATGTAIATFSVQIGDAPAHVAARQFAGQTVAEPRVAVGPVSMPADGELVVHAATEGFGVGERVGERSLSAGRHDEVAVSLDEAYFESLGENGSAQLWATVSVGGDPVTVDGDPVRTRFSVDVGNASEDDWSINTPRPTTAGGTDAPTTNAPASDTATAESAGETPGFGTWAALAALAALVGAAAARRRP